MTDEIEKEIQSQVEAILKMTKADCGFAGNVSRILSEEDKVEKRIATEAAINQLQHMRNGLEDILYMLKYGELPDE